jgi:hypothetical protein
MPDWLINSYAILTGGPDASIGDRVLHLALIACSLVALGQMLTMLGTRWGDHHATLKSFFLSLLIHFCFGLGWASVADDLPMAPPGDEGFERVAIQEVITTEVESAPQPTKGDTPLWQQPLDVPQPRLVRRELETPEAAPDAEPLPPKEDVPTPVVAPDVPQLATAPTDTDSIPELAQAIEVPTSAAPTIAEAPPVAEPMARPDAGPVASAPARALPSRSPTFDSAPASAPLRGNAPRAAETPDELALSVPLPLDDAPTISKPVGLASNEIVRPASPTPTLGTDQQTGTTSASAASEPRPFTRSNTRALPSEPVAAPTRPEPYRPNFDSASDRLASIPRSTPSTDDLLDPQPSVIRPATQGTSGLALPPAAATTYRLRNVERRQDVALKNGGTESSEKAVENALSWLARHQETDGFWDADQHGGGLREVRQIDKGRPAGGGETDTGLTGLAILSFLGAGYTHEEGDYSDNVSRAIHWLIARQRSDGYLGGRATYYDQMYCHGIAAYALAEAYGMQSDPAQFPELRKAVEQAVWYITQTQNDDGGWRYRVGASASDMSMFGWQLMALKSAELAGLDVPADARRGMIQFLRDRSRGDKGGLAGYKDSDQPTPAMTAEALFCKQMYGLKRTSTSSREAVDYLQGHLPKLSSPDEYYWYYGTLAMFQYGGEPWQRWNQSLRDTLIRLQRQSGDHAGSWDPAGPWGSVGGRVYSTTFCVLSLEVYYRFLPLYRVAEE